jgi:enterochelin esterase-like enzyme
VKLLRLITCLVPAMLSAQTAATHQLTLGTPAEGTLAAGSIDTYTLVVRAGDIVTLKVVDSSTAVIASLFDPSRKLKRAFLSTLVEGEPIRFRASESGTWRVSVSASPKDVHASYVITLLGDAAPRPVPEPADSNQSERIARLKTPADVAQFWRDLGAQGSPLIEDVKSDPKSSLVSFLWRGNQATHGALVLYQPCYREATKCLMTRVAGTDLWYKSIRMDRRTRTNYTIVPNPPHFTDRTFGDSGVQSVVDAAQQRDPLNPRTMFDDPRSPELEPYRSASLLELPGAPPQPWIQRRSDIPVGKLDTAHIESKLLKNTRKITVYTPPGYSTAAPPYGLLLVFDGDTYIYVVPTPVILDNLIDAKRIPPVVAVMIGNVERSKELPCNPTFADFLSTELVPWLRSHYNVTTDPRQVTIGGSSYGGLAATWAGLRHPETFGNILSQSGSYWWTPPPDTSKANTFAPDADPSYVAQLFAASPKLPLRFYLDAGSMELDMTGHGGSILVPNRHLRDVLRAKGYDVSYREFIGAHDYASWRETLADGLILLIGTPPSAS